MEMECVSAHLRILLGTDEGGVSGGADLAPERVPFEFGVSKGSGGLSAAVVDEKRGVGRREEQL